MVTDRDRKALDFLQQFRTATPQQIDRIAYNNMKVCYKRLQKLYIDKLIYRADNTLKQGYIYSSSRIRSVKQFGHDSIRNEFFLKLLEMASVHTVLVENVFGSIRPDLLIECTYNEKYYFFLIEVETSINHSKVNYSKYENFFLREWKSHFNEKPIIIYVSDKIIDTDQKFICKHLNSKLDNFIDIFS